MENLPLQAPVLSSSEPAPRFHLGEYNTAINGRLRFSRVPAAHLRSPVCVIFQEAEAPLRLRV